MYPELSTETALEVLALVTVEGDFDRLELTYNNQPFVIIPGDDGRERWWRVTNLFTNESTAVERD